MATTRIRKTFHYPDSSDDEDTVEAGLDAQDQAALLTTLQTRDTTSTRLYTRLLLIFPGTIFLFTLPHLFALPTFVPSLLALTSLAASAYTLYYLPLPPQSAGILVDGHEISGQTGKGKGKRKAVGGYGLNTATALARNEERVHVPWLSEEVQEVLARYMVPGNGAVCGVLTVVELFQGREWREGMMIGGGYLPGLVLTVILWARRELRVVDMSELQQLRS
ncbi:hypothetical protein E8E11_002812 [Didymella keratinophila]|nr:hypothetical protein E8E11_002812 [Didymella keratinophila]